ncbi:MAG: hypothetical protein ACK4ZW_10100 [Blastomonas sp.]
MKISQPFGHWWQPLPLWIKGVTVLVGFPAWFFIVYCAAIGNAKSTEAFSAFGVFATIVVLHIVMDSRNRQGIPERGGGADISDGM